MNWTGNGNIWWKTANPLYLKLKSVMYNGINEFLKVDIKRFTNIPKINIIKGWCNYNDLVTNI